MGRFARKLAEVEALDGRYQDLRARIDAGTGTAGVPPTDSSVATFFEARGIVARERETLAALREQLAAGNRFLSGFTLWMARSNAKRLERLVGRAERSRRDALAAWEGAAS